MEKRENHLAMIQQIINRMGSNSFLLKGWSVGVMIAIFTFASKNNNIACILFTIIPLIVFWGLDSYYLLLEKKFRFLYDDIRKKEEKDIDYDMNFNNVVINVGQAKKISYIETLFSVTESLFYGTCIITTALIYLNL